jgi:hypothetical protein
MLRVLEHQPHLKASLSGFLGVCPDILPVEQNLSAGGLQQSIQMLNQRGLAGTGMPNDTDIFPRIGFKIHVNQGFVFKGRTDAVGTIQIFRF